MTLNAASVKNIPVKKILSADITGDGKADKILITTSIDKDCFIKKLKVKVNNKVAFTKNCTNDNIHSFTARYAKCQIKMNFFS